MIRFVGRSCRLPMASSVAEFADRLYAGTCAISEIPDERWRAELFRHPVPGTKGKAYSSAAGIVDGIGRFDPKVFGISPREADHLDPQQRIFLHVVFEALEDACIPPASLAGQNVGVYVGASTMDFATRVTVDPEAADGYLMTGSALSVIANRISHVFDLRGPSMTVDTACSSSLFALEAAMTALNSGRIDTAIVGATNALLSPSYFVGFSEARMLSPTGLCHAFSDKADGYVRGEGAVAFVLRRVERDEQPPRDYGRLVHVGLNTTGRVANIALPSADAQAALLEETYRTAGIEAGQLAFVEAHGTGTPVGDPIEAAALGRVLGRRRKAPLPIGSVKSNIGHLEAAAGCAGLLKTLIALERGQLAPSVNAQPTNEAIPFGDYNLKVASDTVALDLDDPACRYAGVSAFGFGGANAHAILEAPAPVAVADTMAAPQERIFFTSTFCRDSLRASVAAYRDRIHSDDGQPRDDLLGALLHFRGRNPYRAAIVATDPAATDTAFQAIGGGDGNAAVVTAETTVTDAPPVFMFSGNGAQYAGMSTAALEADAAYRRRYSEIDAAWRALAGWSLIEKVAAPDLADQLQSADVAQPLLFADQVAMAAGLAAKGVTPAAVVGHSGGEIAAACVCGALTLDQALGVLHARSTAQQTLAGQGTMAALQVGAEAAKQAIDALPGSSVVIAAINSPRSVSLSGPVAEISDFIRHARRVRRWACVSVNVNFAFHHPIQDATESDFKARLSGLHPVEAAIPFFSTVTGQSELGDLLDVDYWWQNIRQPVRFRDAISALAREGYRAFVEIGPEAVLSSYTRDTLGEIGEETTVTFTGSRTDDAAVNPVALSAARVLVNGGRIDTECLLPRPRRAVEGLQSYPFQDDGRDLPVTNAILRQMGSAPDYHPLLGVETSADAHMWVRDYDVHVEPQFADHVVAGKPLLPGTAFIEMAVAAAQRALGEQRVELRDLDLLAPIPLPSRAMVEVRTSVADPQHTVRIASRQRLSDEPWRDHAACQALKLPDAYRIDASGPAPDLHEGDGSGDEIYELADEIGLSYGPAFRRVSHYRLTDPDTIEVILSPTPAQRRHAFAIDPVEADAVFHALVARVARGRFADDLLGFVPVRVGRVAVIHPGTRIAAGRIQVRRIGDRSMLADFDYFDEDGAPVARLEGVRFRAMRLESQISFDRHAFTMDLAPLPALDLPGPAQSPSATGLAQQMTDLAAQLPGDDAILLLDAAAQRLVRDALSLQSVADGRIPPCDAANPRGVAYRATLEAIAEASGQAQRSGDSLALTRDTDLPELGPLLAEILAERPDLVSECALLARLSTALPDLFAGRLDWTAEAVFGRAALENLRTGSAITGAAEAWLAKTVMDLAGDGAQPPPLRIGEVYRGRRMVTDRIARKLPGGTRFCVIQDGSDQYAPHAASALPDRDRQIFDLEGGADASSLDVVVAAPTALDAPIGGDQIARYLSLLRPGGLLIVVQPGTRDYLDLIAGIAAPEAAAGPLAGVAEAPGAVRELTAPMGAADSAVAGPFETFGGGFAVILRKDEQATASRTEAEPAPGEFGPINQTIHAALTGHFGVCSHARDAEADLDLLTPYRPGAPDVSDQPLVIVAPPHRSGPAATGLLKARLLTLAQLISHAPAAAKPIWLIAPGGAGYRGATGQIAGQSAIWSFMRTAKNEYPSLEIKCVDLKDWPPAGNSLDTFSGLLRDGTPETEIVIGADGPKALRVRAGATSDAPPAASDAPCRARLCDEPGGGLDNLSWRTSPLPEPGPADVIVQVEATGLNFRDVMWAMGVLPEEALEAGFAGATLGLECAGTVVARGAVVSRHNVGDRVVAIGPSCFASHVAVPEDYALSLPEGVSAEAGASLPVAFFTAWYGLVHLGRLARDETILIHGGAGGVGLAAIQIAQSIGATTIATAGTEVKRGLLTRLGVDHVLNSRSQAFEDEVRDLTGGAGVHVVLNSLSGRPMERSLRLVRPFGRFIELGKLDYYANTSVGLRSLKDNISYFSADLDQLVAQAPDLAQRLFAEVSGHFQSGAFAPLPVRAFDADQAIDAFRAMQRAQHIGKIVVRPPDPATVTREEGLRLYRPDSDRTFVIVGGGGGLGLALAERLIKLGPASIALIGRSAEPGDGVQDLIARAARRESEIRYLSCDIADRAALARTLDTVRAWHPIGDIVHSAMVIEDMRLADLTPETLDRTLAAKVQGAINLDLETRQDDLANFMVFSSMATLIGNHGQSAYVAANGFLEGLIRERRAAGLPGLAVGWGAISDAGYVTRNPELAKLLKRMGGNVDFHVRQAMRALVKLMAEGQRATDDAVVWISPMAWRGVAQGLKLLSGPTHRALWDLGQQTGVGIDTDDLRELLLSLTPDEARERMVGFLKREIARILRVTEGAVPADRPVSDLGVDSLMGVELGLAAQQALGDDIPLMTISESNTLTEIAARIADHIHGTGQVPDVPAASYAPTQTADPGHGGDDSLKAAE